MKFYDDFNKLPNFAAVNKVLNRSGNVKFTFWYNYGFYLRFVQVNANWPVGANYLFVYLLFFVWGLKWVWHFFSHALSCSTFQFTCWKIALDGFIHSPEIKDEMVCIAAKNKKIFFSGTTYIQQPVRGKNTMIKSFIIDV